LKGKETPSTEKRRKIAKLMLESPVFISFH
jgi:hypothetical protein